MPAGSGIWSGPAAERSWTWAATASPSAAGSSTARRSKSVYCQLNTQLHGEKTRGEDNSLCILEFENGAIGLVENSWSHLSGLDDRIEIHGSAGLTYADLNRGNALPTYSEAGYGYAVEKAPSTKGWSYPIFDEHYNFGMPQELRHYARCVQGKEEPLLTGEDGMLVLEIMLAAYASAREGRKLALPFRPQGVRRPIDLWRPPARALRPNLFRLSWDFARPSFLPP